MRVVAMVVMMVVLMNDNGWFVSDDDRQPVPWVRVPKGKRELKLLSCCTIAGDDEGGCTCCRFCGHGRDLIGDCECLQGDDDLTVR